MLKKLADNIDLIEKTVSLYSSDKIKYDAAHSTLVSLGYSHKEASSILLKENEPDDFNTRHRNGWPTPK
jgi:Holliday junction resolvasome RuvABC DNA-binding subunit